MRLLNMSTSKLNIYTCCLAILALMFTNCQSKRKNSPSRQENLSDIQYLNEVIQKYPQTDSLYFHRAQFYMLNSNLDSAISDLRKAISLNNKNPDYFITLSETQLLANNSRAALSILDSALSVLPDQLKILESKARLQLILRQYMEAMATLDHLFLIDPLNAYGYYISGHIFIESGDTGRAINSYQKSVDLDPEQKQAWIQLGDLLSHMKNPLAVKYYDNAIRIDSTDIEVFHNKAFALQNIGKMTEAIQQYKENIKRNNQYELSYYNLGILYKNMDSTQNAIEMLGKSIELNPQESYTYFARGECYKKLKQNDKARNDFMKAMEINPEESDFKKALESLK